MPAHIAAATGMIPVTQVEEDRVPVTQVEEVIYFFYDPRHAGGKFKYQYLGKEQSSFICLCVGYCMFVDLEPFPLFVYYIYKYTYTWHYYTVY